MINLICDRCGKEYCPTICPCPICGAKLCPSCGDPQDGMCPECEVLHEVSAQMINVERETNRLRDKIDGLYWAKRAIKLGRYWDEERTAEYNRTHPDSGVR
jgi:hypothetical protein